MLDGTGWDDCKSYERFAAHCFTDGISIVSIENGPVTIYQLQYDGEERAAVTKPSYCYR